MSKQGNNRAVKAQEPPRCEDCRHYTHDRQSPDECRATSPPVQTASWRRGEGRSCGSEGKLFEPREDTPPDPAATEGVDAMLEGATLLHVTTDADITVGLPDRAKAAIKAMHKTAVEREGSRDPVPLPEPPRCEGLVRRIMIRELNRLRTKRGEANAKTFRLPSGMPPTEHDLRHLDAEIAAAEAWLNRDPVPPPEPPDMWEIVDKAINDGALYDDSVPLPEPAERSHEGYKDFACPLCGRWRCYRRRDGDLGCEACSWTDAEPPAPSEPLPVVATVTASGGDASVELLMDPVGALNGRYDLTFHGDASRRIAELQGHLDTAVLVAAKQVQQLGRDIAEAEERVALAADDRAAVARERDAMWAKAQSATERAEKAEAERAKLRAELDRDRSACTCGCPLAEHEEYGEDGYGCEHAAHECLLTCPAIAGMLAKLRTERDEAVEWMRHAAPIVTRASRDAEDTGEDPFDAAVVKDGVDAFLARIGGGESDAEG